MYEKQLIDKQETRDFFVYMSNRGIQETFPMIAHDPATIYERAFHEIGMGYTALLIFKRMAIVQEGGWTDLSVADEGRPEYYENFLFVQQHSDSEHISYSAFEPYKKFSSLAEAVAAGKEVLEKKRRLYPGQVFTVVCAAFVAHRNWH